MADVNGILEMRGQRGEVGGIVIHVMTTGCLGGASMSPPIMGDDPKAFVYEER